MKKTSPVTPRRFLFTLIAGMLAPGCAHLPQAVGTCGTPGEVYVTSTSDEDGRELLVERVLPGQGNCDDILITRLHYDDRGKLSRRVDEHVRCGVVEESVAAARGDRAGPSRDRVTSTTTIGSTSVRSSSSPRRASTTSARRTRESRARSRKTAVRCRCEATRTRAWIADCIRRERRSARAANGRGRCG